MILNRLEFALVNNPMRAIIQRRFEASRLLRLGGRMSGGTALELGCGPGFGTRLILDVFGADQVDAFDLDPRMVALTRDRIRGPGRRVRLWIGNATAIPVRDESYDAVFDFGIIHHVPRWDLALREVHRVLKVGGRFYVEEVLAGFIDHPIARYLFHHPRDDRFDAVQLVNGVREAGFVVESNQEMWGAFAWLTATKPRQPDTGLDPTARRSGNAPQLSPKR